MSESEPLRFQVLSDFYLREVIKADAATIYQAIDTHRDYLRIWLPFVDKIQSIKDEEAFIDQIQNTAASSREPRLGIWNNEDKFCGLIGFHFSQLDNNRTEIGYWLLPEYQHRGIMTECVRILCHWAVRQWNIKRIQIRCATGNIASNSIPFRLGFQHEGTERAGELLSSGEYADINVYSILSEEITNL